MTNKISQLVPGTFTDVREQNCTGW